MAVLGWWQGRGCADGFLVFTVATLSTGLLQGCMQSAFVMCTCFNYMKKVNYNHVL